MMSTVHTCLDTSGVQPINLGIDLVGLGANILTDRCYVRLQSVGGWTTVTGKAEKGRINRDKELILR